MNIHEETLKIARNLIKKDPSLTDWVISKFPELKESEDEMMIKFIKQQLFNIKKTITENYELDAKLTKAIDWLEKQGEHANFCNKIQIGDKVTRNEDGVLVNLSQLKRVAKKDEKQGEQKTTVIIPMFKVGDEIKTSNEESLTITKIDEKGYWSEDLFICGFDEECKWELVEQKPAWSEEDEEHLNSIISDIKADMGAYPRSQEVIDIYKDEISFLKSLKDRYTWKPSDEQMKVLENVRKILHTNDIYSKANYLMYNFEELIRTLNKLRGK